MPDPTTKRWQLDSSRTSILQGHLFLRDRMTAHELLLAAEELEVVVGADATLYAWHADENHAELLFRQEATSHGDEPARRTPYLVAHGGHAGVWFAISREDALLQAARSNFTVRPATPDELRHHGAAQEASDA